MFQTTVFTPVQDRNVLVLAGDIGTDMLGKDFVLEQLTISPVIYVPGNHEYYSLRPREEIDADWQALASNHPHLHYLVNEGVTINGVRFWGAPWYSNLWGRNNSWYHQKVSLMINDFHGAFGGMYWNISKHINAHADQTQHLINEAGRVDVVVTHWPPTRKAIHPKYTGDTLNPYFVNDADALVKTINAKLWISGHTHEAYSYQCGNTLCVGNPSGYHSEHRESPWFKPDRTIDLEQC